MVWLIIALCLLLFLLLPLRLFVRYQDHVQAWLSLGPIKINLYPAIDNKKNRQKKDDVASPKEIKRQKRTDKESSLAIIKMVLEFLNDFRTKLRVDNLRLRLILADDDPYDLSVNYGRSWIAIASLYPQLERFLIIKNREIDIQCDYTADKTDVNLSIDLSITLGRILHLGIYHGMKLLHKYFSIMNKTKDGAMS